MRLSFKFLIILLFSGFNLFCQTNCKPYKYIGYLNKGKINKECLFYTNDLNFKNGKVVKIIDAQLGPMVKGVMDENLYTQYLECTEYKMESFYSAMVFSLNKNHTLHYSYLINKHTFNTEEFYRDIEPDLIKSDFKNFNVKITLSLYYNDKNPEIPTILIDKVELP